MFSKYQDDKSREWTKVVERYISLHKYIKEVGKIALSQSRSGHVHNDVQLKLVDALQQTDKALLQLKELFKPCLTDVDITNIFTQDKMKLEVEDLTQVISKLKHEKDYLQQQLSDQSKQHGGDAALQIKDLQHEVFENQQIFEKKQNTLLRERYELQKTVLELQQEIQNLQDSGNQNRVIVDEGDSKEQNKDRNLQMALVKKQQEFEETLKTQNDLIYDLKQQLSDSIRDREMFRSLNRDLEMELQKKTGVEHRQHYVEKKIPELPNGKDFEDDYFHRRTLKMGEYNTQMENLKRQQSFQHNQLENDIYNYQPKFKSLEEIPVYLEQEKTFLKSKSYDFAEEEYNTRQEVRHTSSNLEKLKGIQYPTEELQKIGQEGQATQADKTANSSFFPSS